MSVLYVIATPIGNLEDISYRAVRALGDLEALACEDTRRTRILLEQYFIRRPKKLLSYHEHNERQAATRIIKLLESGTPVGLVTKAGYPGVSDPGYRVISQAVERGFRVEVLPGAGAVEAALVVSGLPGASFTFKGFPPRTAGRRRRFLETEKEMRHTLVLFESPNRVGALLAEALATLGDRKAAVCIEMTKVFEQVARGYLSELVEKFQGAAVKGEVTVVIAGNNPKFARGEKATKEG